MHAIINLIATTLTTAGGILIRAFSWAAQRTYDGLDKVLNKVPKTR